MKHLENGYRNKLTTKNKEYKKFAFESSIGYMKNQTTNRIATPNNP